MSGVQVEIRTPTRPTSLVTPSPPPRPRPGHPPGRGSGGKGLLARATAWVVARVCGSWDPWDAVIYGGPLLALAIAISAAAADGSTGQPVAPPAVAAPEAAPAATDRGPAAAGPGSGGKVSDPTGTGGQVTATTAHALGEIDRAFGGYRKGPTLLSASCWDAHLWNPKSDHPKGKGCDFYTGRSGVKAEGAAKEAGDEFLAWLQTNNDELAVSYVIWQGEIWSAERGTRDYTGGGVYDPSDVVGGHWDHLHVSFDR
jgi:hypothetical protein